MKILLATDSPDLRDRVHQATGGAFLALPAGPLPPGPAELFARLGGAPPPDVLLLDSEPAPARALDLAGQLDQQGISVVLVSGRGPEIGLPALRAGVRDIVEPTADVTELRRVLDRAAQARRPAAAAAGAGAAPAPVSRTGRVITVLSPKGGVGKTTVATNLAVGLAATEPHSTVLVDLDVQFGDVASALDLTPEHTLTEAVQGPASRDTIVLKTFLTRHRTGLYVICSPDSPAAADAVTGEQVSHLLRMLASEFRHVVVDTAAGITDHTLAALDVSHDLVLVTSMDVPGVRGLRKELDVLAEIGTFTERRHVVLNLASTRGGLTRADVEATLGRPVDVELPISKAVPLSVNQGTPLLQTDRRDPVARGLRALVDRFTLAALPGPGAKGRHRLRRGRR